MVKANSDSQQSASRKPTLLVIKGPNIGVSYELAEKTRIGRAPENEIQIADPNVSRLHAEVVRSRMSYTIFDRESRNGVAVNDELVPEKVLLRNDEIQVGNTVFLFNPDLNIRNAKFSNNSVFLYSVKDVTLDLARSESQLGKLTGRERESIDFIMQFADLFTGAPAPMSETSGRLMSHVMRLLKADHAVLMMRDGVSGELRPVVALPERRPVCVNRLLLATAVEERQPLLTSERSDALPDIRDDDGEGRDNGATPPEKPSEARDGLSTLCAPIMQDDTVLGVVAVEKNERDYYSLRDLGLLNAIAKLAASTLQAAQLADSLALRISAEPGQGPVVSRNGRVQGIFAAADRAAASDVTVLITGESGTGKEILARSIHDTSKRRSRPFVALNCGAIPPQLFESELFGYERGAFTGAVRTTPGKIEAAHGGTLFLDEIGNLDISLQPKLLRFLQEKVFYRVGGIRAIDADVRILAATNTDLSVAVKTGLFREDLWYRINVMAFEMPPLRQRVEDIAAFADYFIADCARRLGKNILGINDTGLALLQKYSWPGNIRELANAVERAVILAHNVILGPSDFRHIEEAMRRSENESTANRRREVLPLSEIERRHIVAALKRFDWNQARAAEALGVHRNTLRNKIVEYGIEKEK